MLRWCWPPLSSAVSLPAPFTMPINTNDSTKRRMLS
jgi:hypothetical protein